MTEPPHEYHEYDVTFPQPGQVQRVCPCGHSTWWTQDSAGRYLCAMALNINEPPSGLYWRLMDDEEWEAYDELMAET